MHTAQLNRALFRLLDPVGVINDINKVDYPDLTCFINRELPLMKPKTRGSYFGFLKSLVKEEMSVLLGI